MHFPCRFLSPLNYSESVEGGGAGVGEMLRKKWCDYDWLFIIVICDRVPLTSLFLLRMSFLSAFNRHGEEKEWITRC